MTENEGEMEALHSFLFGLFQLDMTRTTMGTNPDPSAYLKRLIDASARPPIRDRSKVNRGMMQHLRILGLPERIIQWHGVRGGLQRMAKELNSKVWRARTGRPVESDIPLWTAWETVYDRTIDWADAWLWSHARKRPDDPIWLAAWKYMRDPYWETYSLQAGNEVSGLGSLLDGATQVVRPRTHEIRHVIESYDSYWGEIESEISNKVTKFGKVIRDAMRDAALFVPVEIIWALTLLEDVEKAGIAEQAPTLVRFLRSMIPLVISYEAGLWAYWVRPHDVVAVPRPR